MSKSYLPFRSIPNLLSLLRIAMIPFFIWAYLRDPTPSSHMLSGTLLIASGITDMLDGYIARRFHMITELGKVLDPIADKLTQLAIILCLALRYPVFILLFSVFFVTELLMLIGGILLYHHRIHTDGAKWFGKLATGFFYISVIAVVLFPPIPVYMVNLIALVNALLLTFALCMYVPVFFTLRRERSQPCKPKGNTEKAGK